MPTDVGLNPFMNQVYFYFVFAYVFCVVFRLPRLNPFMNQVYFYEILR